MWLGKEAPSSLCPLGFWINPILSLMCFLWWIFVSILMHLIATFRRALCSDFCATSCVPSLLESRAHQNWSSWFLRKPQFLLISPTILKIRWYLGRDLLGICSRGRGEAIPQVSPIFVVVCSRFNVWIQFLGGFLGATGQTGRHDRLDRSSAPVRPVERTGQTGPGRSVLQFPDSLPICFVVSLARSRSFVLV